MLADNSIRFLLVLTVGAAWIMLMTLQGASIRNIALPLGSGFILASK